MRSALVKRLYCAVCAVFIGVLSTDPREGSLQQRVLLSVWYGLRGSLYLLLVGVLQHHCVILWAMSTPHNEGFHRGLLSLRGPLGRPASQGVHRSSCFSDRNSLSLSHATSLRVFS